MFSRPSLYCNLHISDLFEALNYNVVSLAPPLRRAGEGERAEESGDTAIQSVAERNAIIGS